MNYLFTPLHTHIDFGFGATGDAFKESADRLEGLMSDRGAIFNEHLPINYLRRHAIELYLKSGIVIVHRLLNLPYGSEAPSSGKPQAFVDGKWKPFQQIHSVKSLWEYLSSLFTDQKHLFDAAPQVDWSFPPEVDQWIEEIETHDPRSTFFRYPDPSDTTKDAAKSVMAPDTPEQLEQRLASDVNAGREFLFVLRNPAGETSASFYFAGDSLSAFANTLKECAGQFYGTHAAMRATLCGGN